MNFHERRRRNGPVFETHEKAHREVLATENWFGDGKPFIGRQFTAAKARERKAEIINLLYRAEKRERRDGDAGVTDRLAILADKIFRCRPGRRCGSLACPECLRAYQKAKVAAQRDTIKLLKATRKNKLLVMVNIIPLMVTYKPEDLSVLKVQKLNRWLKDVLTRVGFKRVMLGSIDFSWEADRGIYQPHWHIAMWTSNREKLTRRLKRIFPGLERGDRPVVASKTYSLGFLPYKDKAIKLPALLRNNRRGLPYLLLALDRTEPLDLMVLFGVRASAQDGGFEFKKIQRRKMAGHRKRRIDEKR
jgi:hypothetical protein